MPWSFPPSDSPELEDPEVYLRRVLIPVRPLDLEALLEAEESEGGCQTGPTVLECVQGSEELQEMLEADADLQALVEEFSDDCFSRHAPAFGMDEECP